MFIHAHNRMVVGMRGGSCPEVGIANAYSAVLLVWPAMTRGQNVDVARGGSRKLQGEGHESQWCPYL